MLYGFDKPPLAAVKLRIGSLVPNKTDEDDVPQETLLRVWRHLSTFRSEFNFRLPTNRRPSFSLARKQFTHGAYGYGLIDC
jgi:hypothetical protein